MTQIIWKFIVKHKLWVIIGILVAIIFLQRSCQHCDPCPEAKTDTVTIVKYDTVERIIYVEKPVPYQIIIPGPTQIDSAKCQLLYRLYNSKNIYLDTLLNDTSAFISVRDTVFQNQLGYRKLYFVNKRPTIIQTTTTTIVGDTTKKRNKVFIGLALGRWTEEFTLGPSLMLVTKKDRAYSLQYDPFYKCAYGTIYWKIKLKNRR